MDAGVSPQKIHGYRCQSTECSWVQMSVHRGFAGTSFIPQSVMGTGVSPQTVHWYRRQSREGS